MPSKTFRGGVDTPHFKEMSASSPISELPAPEKVTIPLTQHIGAPCEVKVEKGDQVDLGQIIADTDAFVSAPIHASVSGTVEAVTTTRLADGRIVPAVVIASDGEDRWHESVAPKGELRNLDADAIRSIMREAGLVGMGGAAFPTHVKYTPPPGVDLHTIIINGCECEPFLTCDHRVMLEFADEIVFGLEAMMKVAGAKRGLIGIEENKPDAIEALRQAVGDRPYDVIPLKVKYPEGAEKQLISALTGQEVPSGGLPLDLGIVVNNVATAVALANAIKTGQPLIDRVVTVSGDRVGRPGNLRVRIGTSMEDVFDACGGLTEAPERIVIGGPMMGQAVFDISIPITKGCSGVLALSAEIAPVVEEKPCIRCGRCVEVCPSFLMPLYIADYPHEASLEYYPLDCIECGSCSYICPADQRLLERIRLAKVEAEARQRSDDA